MQKNSNQDSVTLKLSESLSTEKNMFKSWKSDKNKIKAVFRLQFQATQVRTQKETQKNPVLLKSVMVFVKYGT